MLINLRLYSNGARYHLLCLDSNVSQWRRICASTSNLNHPANTSKSRINVMLIAFAWSSLNDVMTVILNVPAQTISIMAATRLYVMLYQETIKTLKSPKEGYNNSLLPHSCSESPSASQCVGTSSLSLIVSHGARSKVELASSPCTSKSTSELSFQNKIHHFIPSSSPIKYPLIPTYCPQAETTNKRPQTSPASMHSKIHGIATPEILMYETRSIVSEPLPVHLKGHPFTHLNGLGGKKHRQKGTGEDSPFSS